MSGIFGLLAADTREPPGIEAVRDRMTAWGRDGERRWEAGGVLLGHLHQVTTGGGRGQPSRDELPAAGGVVVAADARLDNRDELCDLLDCPPGTADEELVLQAYLRWSEAGIERLSGAFAVAVWDGRRRRLLCARDHAGFRPFAYWQGPAGFVFATDAAAVAACDEVSVRTDEEAAVARFARQSKLLRERSLFDGIAKLPAGELLAVAPGQRARRARHWRPERCAPGRFRSADECAGALRDTLAAATASAVDCSVPVGVHMSGGLDSSAVAAFAQEALKQDGRSLAHAFSWSPPAGSRNGQPDELARIEALAATLAVPVGYTELSEEDLRAESRLDAALEPNELLVYEGRVLREAARAGIGVLLTGWGGDEVASFNGRGELAWLASHGRWIRLWREAAAPARRRGDGRVIRSALRNIVRRGITPLLPDAAYHALRLGEHPSERLLRRAGHGWEALHPLAAEQRRAARRNYRVRRSPRAMQLSILALGHVENRIESWARAGALLGIDHRYPLLDRRVLELCLSFPPDVWLLDGWTRWVFREAVAPVLPASVVWTREKEEPARMQSWLELLADAEPAQLAAGTPLIEAHRRRRQELARMLTGRPPAP